MSSCSITIFCCAKAKLDFLTPIADEAFYKSLLKAIVSDLAKLTTPVPIFAAFDADSPANGVFQAKPMIQNFKIERWGGDKRVEMIGYFRYLKKHSEHPAYYKLADAASLGEVVATMAEKVVGFVTCIVEGHREFDCRVTLL